MQAGTGGLARSAAIPSTREMDRSSSHRAFSVARGSEGIASDQRAQPGRVILRLFIGVTELESG